ncbi:MAG: hypothetical protein HC819_19570 [Cyclobacteriaceae bacterium]|nr:hypothetical protein [Cyclobacteriaceae bacterium]
MPQPQTHYFEVEIRLDDFHGEFVDFKMPVWTPGSYLVREYAKNVEGFTATSGGKSAAFEKPAKIPGGSFLKNLMR